MKTPKERAWGLQTAISEAGDLSSLQLIALLEEAITEAIEEEREACAKIAEHAEHPEYGCIAQEIRNRSLLT